jgi:hypothetical protein
MKIILPQADLALHRHESFHLHDAVGVRIFCICGTLWITQHHDTRDIVMHAGDVFTVERNGVTVVQASMPSRVVIEEMACARRFGSGVKSLARSFARLLARATPDRAGLCRG